MLNLVEVLTYKCTQGWVFSLETACSWTGTLSHAARGLLWKRNINIAALLWSKNFYRWKALSEYLWFNYCITMIAQYCSVLIQVFFYKLINGLLWNDSTSLLKQGYSFNLQALLDFWVWSSCWNLECFCWIFFFFSPFFLTIRTTFILRLDGD